MDGLLIDSEPLWLQAELDVFGALGLDLSDRHKLPDTLGLRIDLVVKMWYQAMPWQGVSLDEVSARIIERAIELVHETRPLLPGVRQALELCREQGLNIGLASASPLHMQQQVLKMFDLEAYFDQLVSAEYLPYSKPHPEVYLIAAERLGSDPLRCITLEDSFNGMIATKAARMRSIVIPAAEYRHDPRWALADHQLETLEQLTPPILPDLRRRPPAPRLSAQRHKGIRAAKQTKQRFIIIESTCCCYYAGRQGKRRSAERCHCHAALFAAAASSRRCVLKTALVSLRSAPPIARFLFTPVKAMICYALP